jgi:hypothetical protein
MTNEQEIRAKSMELALSFMGLISELPAIDTSAEDEAAEFDKAFKFAVYFSRKFEEFILKNPPAPPKP